MTSKKRSLGERIAVVRQRAATVLAGLKTRRGKLILAAAPAAAILVVWLSIPDGKPAGHWAYYTEPNRKSDGTDHYATITSANRIRQRPPYEAETFMDMTIGHSSTSGAEVTLQVSSGQLMCPSYAGCSGTVRFDDGPAREIRFRGFLESGTNTIFVSEPGRFITALKRARRVTIRKTMLGAGTPQFEFDVAGLEWDH